MAALLSSHLKLSEAEHTRLAGARTAAILRHDLPVSYAGERAATAPRVDAADAPGNLRVSILEAEGLPTRPDGAACAPYVVVSVAELTRRRSRRTSVLAGPAPHWQEAIEFDGVGGSAQVVVDVWDSPGASGDADLLGKAVITLDECRPGVPHTFFKNMLVGKLAFRLHFDYGALPDAGSEEAQVQASLAAAIQ